MPLQIGGQIVIQDPDIGVASIDIEDGPVPLLIVTEPRNVDRIRNDVDLVPVDPELAHQVRALCVSQHMESHMASYLPGLTMEIVMLEVDMQHRVCPRELGWHPEWIGGMTSWDDFGPEPVGIGPP